jgi:hypothetical protein
MRLLKQSTNQSSQVGQTRELISQETIIVLVDRSGWQLEQAKTVKHLPHMLGDKEDRKGQILKIHFGLKCKALALILPPEEYKRRTSDDESFTVTILLLLTSILPVAIA